MRPAVDRSMSCDTMTTTTTMELKSIVCWVATVEKHGEMRLINVYLNLKGFFGGDDMSKYF